MNDKVQYASVTVRIPNLEGDGIAESHTIQVPVTLDPHTNEEMLTEEAIQLIDNTKARYMGLLLPPEIKKLRERVGPTQKRVSELFQAGEKSWTRWESGQSRPSRMVNVLLRLVYEGKVFVSDLVAQRKLDINWRENFQPKLERPEVTVQFKMSYEVQHVSLGGGRPPPDSYCGSGQSNFFCAA